MSRQTPCVDSIGASAKLTANNVPCDKWGEPYDSNAGQCAEVSASALIHLKESVEREGVYLSPSSEAQNNLAFIKAGKLGALIPQYDNKTTEYKIQAEDSLINTSSSKGLWAIPPHTDGLSLDQPPRILALYCIEPDVNGVCETSFCKVEDIRRHVSEDVLKTVGFPTANNNPFKYSFHQGVHGTDEKKDLDVEALKNVDAGLDSSVYESAQCFLDTYDKLSQKIRLKKGELLLLDNLNMLHARSDTGCRKRLVLRYWIQ